MTSPPRARIVALAAACISVNCPGRTFTGADQADVIRSIDATDADAPAVSPDADGAPSNADPPVLWVGYDAYRHWDHWPYLHLGERVYMRSTFDRAGANDWSDASHFIRRDDDDHSVTLDMVGPGVLSFVRTNHWHGSPWHYEVDGNDVVVTESSTADPNHPVSGSVFMPGVAFPPPLAVTWSDTQGADLSWAAVGFSQSLTLAYGRTHYGTGYYIVHRYPEGAEGLSHAITAFDPAQPADADAVALLSQAGSDIAPTGGNVHTAQGTLDVPSVGSTSIAALAGPSVIRALRFTVNEADAQAFGAAHVQITWDDRAAPSIDAPVSLLFGTGSLFNRDHREYLVRALPVNVRFVNGTVTLSLYFPMPFQRSAKISLVGGGSGVAGVQWQVRSLPLADPSREVGYLHATYVDHQTPVAGRDLVLLDTSGAEGEADWCGQLVGTSFIFSDRAVFGTLEGDPRFFFDDSQTPQAQGTGTEEWAGGGDYWGNQTMTLPLVGHPVGAASPGVAMNNEDLIESAYRFLLADAMPFGRNARIQLEHGGIDESVEHYRSVVFWYGHPGACLIPTDAFHVGDAADEQRHGYQSATASDVETLTSRYEWGVDHVGATEIFPAVTDTGRHMTGTSSFDLAIDSQNVGVLLRRSLDASFPDQRADVYVAPADGHSPLVRAGTWYLAGSNRCVFSSPPGETDGPDTTIQTADRRWRDDEFLLPRALTRGLSRIRIEIRFTPAQRPIVPGSPLVPQAWSEFRYRAYSYVLPADL